MTAATADPRDLESTLDGTVARIADHPARLGLLPDLFAPVGLGETLQTVVNLARQSFSSDGAGLVLAGNRSGSLASFASGADAARADQLQVAHQQGPAFSAFTSWEPVLSPELRFDSRWRFWGPQAADLGFRSLVALTLADGDPFGALILYSRRPGFFRADSLAAELAFAQQASVAIAVSVEREQLVRARDSRGLIGQAQGILMERYGIDADQAFAMLRRYSSHLNQKVRLVAQQLISDRTLPELERIGLAV